MKQFWLSKNILLFIKSQVIFFSPSYILSTLALIIFFIGLAGDQTLNSSVHFYVGTLEKRCDSTQTIYPSLRLVPSGNFFLALNRSHHFLLKKVKI
jgi:hypothetical protein